MMSVRGSQFESVVLMSVSMTVLFKTSTVWGQNISIGTGGGSIDFPRQPGLPSIGRQFPNRPNLPSVGDTFPNRPNLPSVEVGFPNEPNFPSVEGEFQNPRPPRIGPPRIGPPRQRPPPGRWSPGLTGNDQQFGPGQDSPGSNGLMRPGPGPSSNEPMPPGRWSPEPTGNDQQFGPDQAGPTPWQANGESDWQELRRKVKTCRRNCLNSWSTCQVSRQCRPDDDECADACDDDNEMCTRKCRRIWRNARRRGPRYDAGCWRMGRLCMDECEGPECFWKCRNSIMECRVKQWQSRQGRM